MSKKKTARSTRSSKPARTRSKATDKARMHGLEPMRQRLPPAAQIAKDINSRLKEYRAAPEGKGLRLVAHGDSWFDYPISNPDYPKYGSTDITIWLKEELIRPRPYIANIAHHGDAMDDILSPRKIKDLVRALSVRKPDAILLSAGGNDIIVGNFYDCLVDANTVNQDPDKAISRKYEEILDRIISRYEDFKRICDEHAPNVPILCHSYDFARPTNIGVLRCALGPWLFPALSKRGWMKVPKGPDLTRGSYIVKQMLQRFDARLRGFAKPYTHVTVLRTQGTITSATLWDNETHLKPEGFRLVAQVFADALVPQVA